MVNDFAQAAWHILAGLLAKNGSVKLHAVSVRPEKTALLKHLILMNVSLHMGNHCWIDDEPVADFVITPPKKLLPIRVREQELPALVETLPVLLVAAACADGSSFIPYHDSARMMIDELQALGADMTVQENMLKIVGQSELKILCYPLALAKGQANQGNTQHA